MASKSNFHVNRLNKTVDGYRVNEQLGLYLDAEENLWRGIHLKTGDDIVGPHGRWKKKRSCLAFIESFVDFDWDVVDEEDMYSKNNGFEVVKERYFAAVKVAEGLE